MDTITNTMGSGARGMGFAAMGEEMYFMLQEESLAFVLVMLLILCDFRLGRRESSERYALARESGDTYALNKYRWRTSRAIRRSMNKLLDYTLFALLGLVLGAHFLEDLGVQRIWGTHFAVGLICFCELQSIIGHFFFLHEKRANGNKAWGLVKRFAVIFVKKKDEDAGEALEEALNAAGRK